VPYRPVTHTTLHGAPGQQTVSSLRSQTAAPGLWLSGETEGPSLAAKACYRPPQKNKHLVACPLAGGASSWLGWVTGAGETRHPPPRGVAPNPRQGGVRLERGRPAVCLARSRSPS
jgi:hypothetical protein